MDSIHRWEGIDVYSKPTSPQSIGRILDSTFRLTGAGFAHTWLYAVLAGVSSYIGAVYRVVEDDSSQIPHDPIYWLLYIVGLVLSSLFFIAIYQRLDAIAEGRAPSQSTLATALSRLPLYVVMNILYGLAIVLGTILLIIPGMILMVSLAISSPVYLFERQGPVKSLLTSHELVWGNWWRTATILTVAGIVAIVLYVVCGLIAGAIAAVAALNNAAMVVLISTLIVMALVSILLLPLFAALMLNIYWDLKLRRQGDDLAARAQAI